MQLLGYVDISYMFVRTFEVRVHQVTYRYIKALNDMCMCVFLIKQQEQRFRSSEKLSR